MEVAANSKISSQRRKRKMKRNTRSRNNSITSKIITLKNKDKKPRLNDKNIRVMLYGISFRRIVLSSVVCRNVNRKKNKRSQSFIKSLRQRLTVPNQQIQSNNIQLPPPYMLNLTNDFNSDCMDEKEDSDFDSSEWTSAYTVDPAIFQDSEKFFNALKEIDNMNFNNHTSINKKLD
jgi:hypothetical protein